MCHKKLNIARVLSFLVAVLMTFSMLPNIKAFAAAESGECGKNLKWSYSAGTLTITGKGDMKNYSEKNLAPWNHLSQDIVAVSLPKNITSIGTLAFYNCTSLKAISIPDKVEKISDKAFYNCTSIRLVDLPESLKSIGKSAFYNCENLASVSLPDALETISDKAFYLCRGIRSITVPQSVKTLGKQAFAYCESLVRVEIKAQITAIPEWCFYGCTALSQIELPSTVTQIDSYAFKRCDELYTVYHSGDKNTANSIRNQISNDLPDFKNSGYVSSENIKNETQTSDIKTDKDGNLISQTNTWVRTGEGITLVATINTTKDKNNQTHYAIDMTLTIEGDDYWANAIVILRDTLSKINDSYSPNSQLDQINLTLYIENTYTVNKHFLKELAGRKMMLEVVDASGSVWCIDCSELKFDEIKADAGLSYTVTDANEKTSDKLGTDECYQVTFKESSDVKTNVVITLPDTAANSNAFLYQMVGGKPQRLQASVVDLNSNAYFYVSSINKNTKYVIGINVPGESVDDIIIPDQSKDPFGAIARLEKIEYVKTGVRTLAGFTLGQIILIVIGILIFIAIVVGVIMYMMYKNNPQKYAFAGTVVKKIEKTSANTNKFFKSRKKK